ncbi:hypothetical protein [Thalassotalea sp. Y01]|uniref:hypothetical protein n=1 Tax=Thalassotalea sp. Y01 TaxID=2729613 RepID=UPI00145F1829|nr:hypothetical protein [Thalassotalea sp. Y01]NMP17511.1 hypothetical protein [Thalassotalea sp. Y01]
MSNISKFTTTDVVDSVMGSGKSTATIDYIKNSDNPVLLIVEYDTEVDRFLNAIPEIVSPKQDNGYLSRYDSLVNMLESGESIVSTHQLFSKWDDKVLHLIKANGYELIMDEVLSGVLSQVPIDSQDIVNLIEDDYMVQEFGSDIPKLKPTGKPFYKEYSRIEQKLRNKDIYLSVERDAVNKKLYIFEAPSAKIFEAFHKITILTYLFDGSLLSNYFDLHDVEYELKSVVSGEMTDYQGASGEQFKDLITIYNGKHNEIGRGRYALSLRWYERGNNPKVASKAVRSVFNNFKVERNLFAWSVHKDVIDKVAHSDFHSKRSFARYDSKQIPYSDDITFISQTTRASNQYKNKAVMAYCSNTFMRPVLRNFLTDNGVDVQEDKFALSQLIQWIWRSRIRNGEPIAIYIPSKRMRQLLMAWLGYDKNEMF